MGIMVYSLFWVMQDLYHHSYVTFTWVVFQNRVPFTVLFVRVPYYIGDLKGDPNLENYPYK